MDGSKIRLTGGDAGWTDHLRQTAEERAGRERQREAESAMAAAHVARELVKRQP